MLPDNTDDDAKKAAADAEAAKKAADAAQSPLVNKGAAPSLNLAGGGGPLVGNASPTADDPVAKAKAEEVAAKTEAENGVRLAEERDKRRKEAEQAAETEITGKAKLDAEKRAADAKADKESLERQQDLDIRAKKFLPEPFKPIPYKPVKPTGPVEQWGSFAMMFAMLGSMFTRNHAVTALNAATAAMNGFKQGDEAVAKQSFEEWKVANQNLMDAANYQQKVYDNIMKDVQDRKQYEKESNTAAGRQRTAEYTAAALAFGDTTKLAILKSNNAADAYSEWERGKEQNIKALEASIRVEKAVDEAKYNAITKKWTPQTPIEQKIADAYGSGTAKGRTEAEGFEKSLAYRKQADAEKLKALDEDPKYIEAKRNNDFAVIMEMRADAGSVPDQRKFANYLERQSKKQLTPEELLDQAINDRLIATYMRPFPLPSGRSLESQQNYDARMARVQKLSEELTGKPYEASQYDREVKGKQRWSNPDSYISKMLTSLNTLAGHLNETEDLVKASKGDNTAWLRVRNAYGRFTGNPDLASADLSAVSNITTDELAKFVLGGATARGDREDMNNLINSGQSKNINLEKIQVLKNYIAKRAESYERQYMAETGEDEADFAKFFTPETLKTYGKDLRIPQEVVKARTKQDEEAAQRAGVTTPTAPGATPAATAPTVLPKFQGKTPAATLQERPIIKDNGKWVFMDTGEEVKQ